jgi:exopolysaccharide biosynthesis polyprenyl glycosylphosphotransferase
MITLYDEKEKLIGASLLFFDIVLIGLAFMATDFFAKGLGQDLEIVTHPRSALVLLMCTMIYLISFMFFGFYKTFRHQSMDHLFSMTLVGVLFGSMGVITLMFVLDVEGLNRGVLGIFSLTILAFLVCAKTMAFVFLKRFRVRGYNYKNVLIIGSKTRAQEMIDAIYRHPGAGYRVIGCLEIDNSFVGKTLNYGAEVIGTLREHYRDIVMNQEVDELVFAIPLDEIKGAADYVALAEEMGVNIRVLPDWQIHRMTYSPGTASIYYDKFLGLPTLALSSIPQKETELFLKAVIDYAGACALLVLTSPVMALTAIAIKLTSPGPILFRQTRSGLNGRRFTVYKFRSMTADAEQMKEELKFFNEEDGPAFKIKDDPRLTPVGRFIRTASIDELPQLINVLRGEMSLVGPRPPIPEEVTHYKPWQRRRLSLKPGLTCIWQVKARNNTDFNTWMKLDLEYIDNWSIFLDLKLLLLTIPAVLSGTGR